MIGLIEYNWQVRDEWLDWCEMLSTEQLYAEQTGGAGSILYTLFHIVEVENSWLRAVQNKQDVPYIFEDYSSLDEVKALSNTLRKEHALFLRTDLDAVLNQYVQVSWDNQIYQAKDILHHLIIHEVHHIGQLSIWARQMNKQPIESHYVGRQLKRVEEYI
ncbi:DinB family protein [Alkalicoccobacillus porphyridii]|uniref:DUF664 domain-containing protein n=1 Tax=Alkalicoccobacillus porphyridii TaxID=2597270 RepID=A0A553ZVH6_9BACI|nr:DinB family protein [Alkalicoccobacillus porphyridii]TSB45345.1 DUF664 domain-containing protein [Alkalicoccobacillus porphyridii]